MDQNLIINANVYGYKLTMNIDTNTEFGDDLVTPKEVKNAKDIETLTDEEKGNIAMKALTGLSEIELFSSIADIIDMLDFSNLPNDDATNF